MNLKISIKTVAFLLLSAFCYGLSFVLSNHLWWLIFFYPIFLFLISEKIGFFYAFFWSLIAHGIHLVGIAVALYQMNTSLWIIIGMFLYVAITNGFIFACIKKISSCIEKGSYPICPTMSNAIAVVISHYWMTKLILFSFGRIEGYVFMNPTILLVCTPLQAAIGLYNGEFLILLFYCLALLFALFVQKKQRKYLFINLFCLLLLVGPSVFKRKTEQITPALINKIAVLPLFFPNPTNLSAIRDIIEQNIELALQKNPALELFVFPEGAINCPLSSEQVEKFFAKKTTYSMIICSQCFKKQKLRNSCFLVTNNTCQTVYHKRHALPVTERPILYQTTNTAIRPSKNNRPLFSINQNFSLIPYICSDFFFNEKQDDSFHNVPIIALCNDIWFSDVFSRYIQKLMLKTAQCKAINWHRPIVYVSYGVSYYIHTNGNLIEIAQIR